MRKKHRVMNSQYDYSFSNELIAKLLAAVRINPAVAVGRGSEYFFSDEYETLFDSSIATYHVLAPWLLNDIIRDTYIGNNKPFHEFEQQYVFKRRALFHVLRLIYDIMKGSGIKDWQKKFIGFWDNSTEAVDEWNSFIHKLNKIIDSMFETIYRGFRDSGEGYHNTYLQRNNTLREIKKLQSDRFTTHSNEVRTEFSKILT